MLIPYCALSDWDRWKKFLLWVLIAQRGWLLNRCWLSDWNLPLKKSRPRHTGELCPNSPNYPIASQKIKVDNKARFRYQVGYWFRLIDASICGASAETDTQLSIFDSSASEKQLPIFLSFSQKSLFFKHFLHDVPTFLFFFINHSKFRLTSPSCLTFYSIIAWHKKIFCYTRWKYWFFWWLMGGLNKFSFLWTNRWKANSYHLSPRRSSGSGQNQMPILYFLQK